MYAPIVYAEIGKDVPKALSDLSTPEKKEAFEAAIATFRQLVETHLTCEKEKEAQLVSDPIPRLLLEIGGDVYQDRELDIAKLREHIRYGLEYFALETANTRDPETLRSSLTYQRFVSLFSRFNKRLSSR